MQLPPGIHIAFILYTGIATLGILFFLFLIARFYQIKSGENTLYPLFLVPMGLVVVAMVRYMMLHGMYLGDELGDAAWLIAGALLLWLGSHMLYLMTGNRKGRS